MFKINSLFKKRRNRFGVGRATGLSGDKSQGELLHVDSKRHVLANQPRKMKQAGEVIGLNLPGERGAVGPAAPGNIAFLGPLASLSETRVPHLQAQSVLGLRNRHFG